MYDKQANSLWVHVTGQAFEGLVKGTNQELIPSTVDTWENWRLRYPDTLVLVGARREYFMGTYSAMADCQDEIGLVVSLHGKV